MILTRNIFVSIHDGIARPIAAFLNSAAGQRCQQQVRRCCSEVIRDGFRILQVLCQVPSVARDRCTVLGKDQPVSQADRGTLVTGQRLPAARIMSMFTL